MTTGLKEIQQLAVRNVPIIKIGQTVRVHLKIKEGEKERIQIFEGLIIKINSGTGADKTFTVRKLVQGIGVEKNLSLYSPLIEKIEVKKEAKVRRAKLYYMRERFGKSARLREGFVSEQEMEQSIEELAAQKAKEEAANADEEGESESEDVKVEAENPEEPAIRTEDAPEEAPTAEEEKKEE